MRECPNGHEFPEPKKPRKPSRRERELLARIAELEAALRKPSRRERELLARVAALESVLRAAKRLFDEALPKFNWGASALDANAIRLLNEVPILVAAALAPEEQKP